MRNKEQQAVFELKLFLPYEFKCFGNRCSEKISLPATEEQLDEVRKSMGAGQLEQCHIISLVSIKPDLVDYLPQNAFCEAQRTPMRFRADAQQR